MKFLATTAIGLILSTVAIANNTNIRPDQVIAANATNVVVTGTETDGGVGDCSFVTINITADIEGVNDLGGGNDQVRFSVFDDGTEEDFEVVTVAVGDTDTVNVTLTFEGLVGVGAAGVGVLIWDGPTTAGSVLFSEDPFLPDTVPGTCAGAGPLFSVPVNSPWMIGSLAALMLLIAMVAVRRRQIQ